MAASMDLCALDDVQDWIKRDDTVGDDTDRLNRLIDVASSRIEDYCNRLFLKTSRAYVLNGNGESRIKLPNWPCYPSESITIEYLEGDGTTWTADSTLNPATSGDGTADGIIFLRDGIFAQGTANIRVTTPTGLATTTATLPPDLVQAAIEFVQHLWAVRFEGRGHLYDSISTVGDGQTQTFKIGEMPLTVKAVLDQKYRRRDYQ